MNTADIKGYAPQARKDFIAAVTGRAALYGLTGDRIEPVTVQGDVAIIAGRAHPKAVAVKRQRLEERVAREGFQHTIDAIAYTWFNRFAALRYMELHGYLGHGYRVLSHPAGDARPEILDHAVEVDLPGLDRSTAMELKLDGTKDEELYRLLLLAQCNALHEAMPFLFERLGDETELLLPGNLLHSGSLVRKLVEEIDEEQWTAIEIVGWLYQFYISEKKAEVIGKVVKSEDIPAATQLFTPNWIVKYMVQNSLGAQWLATYPDSPLKAKMEYYVEPAEQTEEVKAQLAAITPTTLDPGALTVIDPACGSGHILVEAYELFKAIYLERGYRLQDLPRLILEKNLFGLDIDERAAQLAGFALMMKGRADDRRLFERGVKLNVMAVVDSAGFHPEALASGVDLSSYDLTLADVAELNRLFEHATTFGSLIQVPEELAAKLSELRRLSDSTTQDLFVTKALKRLRPLVRQAEMLARRYDAVVANPPYHQRDDMDASLKRYVDEHYRSGSTDLCCAFMLRNSEFSTRAGIVGMITMQSWMFLVGSEDLRSELIHNATIFSMLHLGARAFDEIPGEVVQTTAFTFARLAGGLGVFHRLVNPRTSEAKRQDFLAGASVHRDVDLARFKSIPKTPFAYWASAATLKAFANLDSLGDVSEPRQGLITGATGRFLRLWHEVSRDRIGFGCRDRAEALASKRKWFPQDKGGAPRRWYGNNDTVVNWQNDGEEIKNFKTPSGRLRSRPQNMEYYFEPGVTWTKISSGRFACRYVPRGSIFSDAGMKVFHSDPTQLLHICELLNASTANHFLACLSSTINYEQGNISRVPVPHRDANDATVQQMVSMAKADWDAFESSWDFGVAPLLRFNAPTLQSAWLHWEQHCASQIETMRELEERSNRLCIQAYGLSDELNAVVSANDVTLARADQASDATALVSYAIGCMMGRYSLDEPGLIYARSGNEGFDPSRYTTFPADPDGILPLTDTDWFADDACHRLVEFLSIAWDKAHLEENLAFLAANLSPKKNETPRETLRRYLSDKFFKDHLQTYKKRPIYWLFSSGKQRAFQALVYLHRYNEGTLARMRTEYVVPLQGMIASQVQRLADDLQKLGESGSTAQRKKLEKERDRLLKHRTELQEFDEKLRHYADMRIALDLDDGVKVNYGKFGDLLAEVKTVTGGDED